MKPIALFSLIAVSLTATTWFSVAAQGTSVTPATNTLTVAELFTSQGCSSCPPAERLFSSLAEKDNVLTIEWHVDIWDDLVHGGSRWKDPYSSDEFTDRQRSYNRSIRGQNGIYTPQAVVNGQLEGVGSRSGEVSYMLENSTTLPVSVQIANNKVTVAPSDGDADVLFVRLLKKQETNVKGGENKGRQLAGKNIALSAKVLGQSGGKTMEFKLPSIGKGETCAVLVQRHDGEIGPILGAAKCA